MEIRITGWGYENIRRLNTLDVDLSLDGGVLPHATLVMMKNGTGKTTTLHLMRATLSGNAIKWTAQQIKEYQPVNSDKSTGKFYIKIRFGNEPYRYTLSLDYERGEATYETSRVGLSGGLEDGHRLPPSMRKVLDSDGFVDRFIFDGEQAKKTLNSDSKEAEHAVVYLYQIDKLQRLRRDILNMMQQKQSASESKGATSISLKNNKTRRENKKQQFDKLSKKQSMLKHKIGEMESQKAALEVKLQKLVESDDTLKNQQKKLNKEKDIQENNLVNSLQAIGRCTKYPFNVSDEFNRRLTMLTQNMQTLKLPKTTAREFFKELAESDDCICGRGIGPNEKEAIRRRADLYLGAEDLSAINAIKDKLRNYSKSSELADALIAMTDTKEYLNAIKNELNRLVMQLDEDAMRESEKIKEELEALDEKLRTRKDELVELEAPATASRANEQNNLQIAKRVYEEADQNYQRALGTYEYTQRATTLTGYIEKTENIALGKLKSGIIQKTNQKIAEILQDDHIIVDKIEGNLVLHDRSGVSEGQTLAIAYSYIGSLFEHSSYEFPFVIDSPAASMDLSVRREVATIIPQLFKQLIIFVTSGEVAGFAEKFYSSGNTKFLTIEGQSDGENAILTEGQEYFANYQNEEAL